MKTSRTTLTDSVWFLFQIFFNLKIFIISYSLQLSCIFLFQKSLKLFSFSIGKKILNFYFRVKEPFAKKNMLFGMVTKEFYWEINGI